MKLEVTDNTWNIPLKEQKGFVEGQIGDLKQLSGSQIKTLQNDDNRNLLIFPHDLHEYGDEISEETICELDESKDGPRLTTGNIMGFVGLNDTQLTIRSRFSQGGKEDYFLHYMLQKVFCINVFDLKHETSGEDVFDFMLYLFPCYLKKAMRQGLFKEYQRREYNDANVRGPIDLARHIRMNVPFAGRIAYKTREQCYDNHITQLIRHTIEYIRRHPFGANILNNDPVVRDFVSQIELATPSYDRNSREQVINANLRPVCHPFYSEYTGLQDLCVRILRHKSLKYGQEKDTIYGILFDGAWLWEEYLATILCGEPLGFKHPRNKAHSGGIWLFEKDDEDFISDSGPVSRCRRYPDFYKDDFILDAKYKRLESGYIDRDDMHQIIAYMHVQKASRGGLIYPLEANETTSSVDNLVSKRRLGKLRGDGGEIWTYGVKIPKGEEIDFYCKYCRLMDQLENSVILYFV